MSRRLCAGTCARLHLLQVYAVFGFCDIRQFTDATEVLQEDVMEFVNSISKIVHMEVSLHGGFPNKNIGDAFLLVSVKHSPSGTHILSQLPSECEHDPPLELPSLCTRAVVGCAGLSLACLLELYQTHMLVLMLNPG